MPAPESSDQIVGEIYEASSRPKHWEVVLEMVAQNINADSVTLIFRDFDNSESDISFVYTRQAERKSEQMVKDYEKYYHRFDPMWQLAAEHTKIGIAIADNQFGLSRKEYEAHCPPEYLEGYMRKYDIWHIGGSYLFQDDEKALVVAVQRGINSQPWTDKEMDYLTSLTPHFQRAFRIHREFIELRTSVKHLQTCIDRLLMGLIIVRPNGKTAFINNLAKKIITTNPVITNDNYILRATPAHNDIQLQKLINNARYSDIDSDEYQTATISAIALRLGVSAVPLPMLITPINHHSDEDQNQIEISSRNRLPNHVAIFFADPERSQQYSQDVISEFYGLTSAEARVAIAISNGYTVAQYANKNKITEYTVRSQVKQIFQKLNVSRQAEVVKMLLQTPNITLGTDQRKIIYGDDVRDKMMEKGGD